MFTSYQITMLLFHCLFFLTLSFCTTGATKIKLCKLTNPNLEQCVTNLKDSMMSALLNGVPKFGVPSYQPLIIPSTNVSHKIQTPKVEFVGEYTNMNFFNFPTSNIYKINHNHPPSKFFYNLHGSSPELKVTTDFRYAELFVGGMNLSCSGEAVWIYSDVEFEFDVRGTVDEGDDGHVRPKITDTKFKFKTANFTITFVSKQFPERAKELNTIFKNNAASILKDTVEEYEKIYNLAIREALDDIALHAAFEY